MKTQPQYVLERLALSTSASTATNNTGTCYEYEYGTVII
jgi:hypothetical protein